MRLLLFILIALVSSNSFASVAAQDWQLSFQKPVTQVMEDVEGLHRFIMYILSFIVMAVFSVLTYIVIMYNNKSNPIPSKSSNNVKLEIIWTIIPVIILIVIAIPSFRILSAIEHIPNADMTVKVVGNQWYWTYSYTDNNISFDSNMIADQDLKPGDLRLLEVDNRLVIPVDTVVKFLITGSDVIHSFSVPAFGMKMDAVPGRINETWVKLKELGVYYGQCSELCGVNHGFMPISVEVVSKEDFQKWLEDTKTKFSLNKNILKQKMLANKGL
jgi:cytochrome c oxidase subunit 2